MSLPGRWLTIARIRRLVQILLLLAFFVLVLLTRFKVTPGGDLSDGNAESSAALQAPAPLIKLFFIIDPLITAATALAAHDVPRIALWSLATIVITILLGRVF